MLREIRVIAVGVEAGRRSPILLLQEVDRTDRMLPIWVGLPEAGAVTAEWRGVPSPRPTAHRLLGSLIGEFGRRLEQARIVALRDGVFHAELVFDAGTVVSARPSDAIALALSVGVQVLVDETVLDRAALPSEQVAANDTAQTAGAGEEVERFRRFLDDIDPEDFDTTR